MVLDNGQLLMCVGLGACVHVMGLEYGQLLGGT